MIGEQLCSTTNFNNCPVLYNYRSHDTQFNTFTSPANIGRMLFIILSGGMNRQLGSNKGLLNRRGLVNNALTTNQEVDINVLCYACT